MKLHTYFTLPLMGLLGIGLFILLSTYHPANTGSTSTHTPKDQTQVVRSGFSSGSSNSPRQTSQPTSDSSDSSIRQSRHTAITNAVGKVSDAVVSITVTEVVKEGKRVAFDPFYGFFVTPGRERKFESMGSGFIISKDGKVVTNEHVCGKNAKKIMVSLTNQKGNTNSYEATLLGADEYSDLALLQIQDDREFPHVYFGNSDNVIVGEWSIAIGNPFGLFDDGKPTVTVGVISAVSRDFKPNPDEPRVYLDMLQTDASINRGNSGGPLVNSHGEVIGVNTFIYTGGTSSGFVGLGFAIPSNRVQKIIKQLEKSGKVELGFDPGFDFAEITRNIALKYNLPTTQGMLVTSVNKDGPAYEAGIMPGDIILSIGNERVNSKTHTWAVFREYQEGDTLRIELLRKGKRYETNMVLRKKVKDKSK